MQFVVYFEVVVDVEDEVPENIHHEAMTLLSQGIGSFEYESVNDNISWSAIRITRLPTDDYPRPD